jgi:hypothetical protein
MDCDIPSGIEICKKCRLSSKIVFDEYYPATDLFTTKEVISWECKYCRNFEGHYLEDKSMAIFFQEKPHALKKGFCNIL